MLSVMWTGSCCDQCINVVSYVAETLLRVNLPSAQAGLVSYHPLVLAIATWCGQLRAYLPRPALAEKQAWSGPWKGDEPPPYRASRRRCRAPSFLLFGDFVPVAASSLERACGACARSLQAQKIVVAAPQKTTAFYETRDARNARREPPRRDLTQNIANGHARTAASALDAGTVATRQAALDLQMWLRRSFSRLP